MSGSKIASVVIGIPSWPWKQPLLRYAKKHPNIVKVSDIDICHECSRHLQLLNFFSAGKGDFKKTEYFRYQSKNDKSAKEILKKIEGFKDLFSNIKKDGCKIPPVITDDGCRLDGSHRSAIMTFLGMPIKVNVVRYENLFDKKKSQSIRQKVAAYRKEVYGL